MNDFSRLVAYLLIITAWLAGIVLAKGWATVLAVIIPFYAWYLVVERAMQSLGWVS